MITFIQYLSEAKISSSGLQAERHKAKYIDPHIGSKEATHTLATEHEGLAAGSKLKLHSVSKDKNGHYQVEAEDEHGKRHTISVSKFHKPDTKTTNKGHEYEEAFIHHLKKHGIMPHHISGAGSTAGTDFVVENKKKKKSHKGKVTHGASEYLNGETKQGISAAFGQLTINHSREKGWHISDKARKKRPEYAKAIEEAGIIEYMNKHHDSHKHEIRTTKSGRAETIVIKHDNLHPAEAYLKDHHVHLLQVGTYGSYSVGEHDHTGHGLPRITGKGKWTIREKQAGNKSSRTVMFSPDGVHGLNKSHIDLHKEADVEEFKKTLGIK